MTLYISDLDGTLLDDSARVSERTVRLINSAIDRGADFTVATARTSATAGIILKDLNIKLPAILMNGVLIYDFGEKRYIYSAFIGGKKAEEIAEVIEKWEAHAFVYTIENEAMHTYYQELSTQAMKNFYEERRKKYYKSFTKTEDFSQIDSGKVIYFTLIDSYERLVPLYEEISQISGLEITFYQDNYSDTLWYMEVFSADASKKKAVERLKSQLSPQRTVCFGDNLNDISMFEVADVGVAVENAVNEVKKCADVIIGKNSHDAVAEFIYSQFER